MGSILGIGLASMFPTLIRRWPGPQALFYFNGGVTIFTVIFIIVFIKETAHLTDREKKVVYAPEEYREKVKQMIMRGFGSTDIENLSKKTSAKLTLTQSYSMK
jgi:hypothetical protein